jgi:hypothetical protein
MERVKLCKHINDSQFGNKFNKAFIFIIIIFKWLKSPNKDGKNYQLTCIYYNQIFTVYNTKQRFFTKQIRKFLNKFLSF